MKKYLILFIFTCSTSILLSQTHEVGVFLGGTSYTGEIGSKTYIKPNNIGAGLIYKYNLNPRIALRGTYTRIAVSGNNSNLDNDFTVTQSLSFNNTIRELAVGIEFNYFEYNTRKPQSFYTPYILLEISNFYYKTIKTQSATNTTFKNSSSFAIPVGLGFKGHLSKHLAYAFESAIRFTFIDDIDATADNINNIDFQRFGNDHYLFTGISLVYTFGRPACYAKRE